MVKRYLRLALLAAAATATAGCPGPQQGVYVLLSSTDIKTLDPVQVRVTANNPWGHQLEYRFAADRGFVDNRDLGAIATYYAPYTGGADTVHVSVFDRFDGVTVAQQDVQVLVNGESLVSVDTGGKTLGPFDNGTVRINPVRGFGQAVTLGQGRMPQISPDGRFLAFVKYVGDGTSQVFVRDPAGGERNITNHQSFNVDPAWAPINSSRQLVLVFSSDRISTGQGQSTTGHSDHYNLWRTNVDTGDLRPVTSITASARQPSWSPDGRFIVFSSNLDNNLPKDYWNLYQSDVQTGKLNKLTFEASPTYGCYEPIFSPNGSRLAYTRKYLRPLLNQQLPLQKVFVLNVAAASLFPTAQSGQKSFGQFLMNQQDQSRSESAPSWSPDGNELAFVQTIGSESRVFRVNANPPGFGFNYDQMAEVGVSNAIEARWARQNYMANYAGGGGAYQTTPGLPF
ncbi:MAG: PD40 domain-containing protein [Candidatus Sericytochromatia bacterium]|nr:PD40 domain-containing protein [Candidatus Sericytochromatia bacterium]